MMRTLIAIAALVACSGAWAEIVSLKCNHSASSNDDIFTIDLEKKVADWTMASRHSDHVSRFPVKVLWIGPSVITLSNPEYKNAPAAYWEKKIDRVSLQLESQTWSAIDGRSMGVPQTVQCEIVDTPKAQF